MPISLQAVVALDSSRFTGGLKSISNSVSQVTGAMMAAFGGLGGEILALQKAFGPLGAAVGVFKEAATHGVDFEQAMANVRSVTGLAADEIKRLGTETVEFAANTRYSAKQAADALYALGSSGVSARRDLMDILKPALLLAGATLSDSATTTEAVTSTLQNLRMSFSDAGRVANQFAGVIAASPANMTRLSEALKYAAPSAGAFKMRLEDMVKELGAMHLAGLKGEMAGTAFRMALIDLTEAAAKGGTAVADALQGWTAASEGLTGAIRRFEAAGISADQVVLEFGARSGQGLAAMLNIGSKAIEDMGTKINGLADVNTMYNIQMDTLSGKLAVLRNHFEEIGHVIFEKVQPALTAMVGTMQQAVDWVGRLAVAMAHGNWAAAWTQLRTTAETAFHAVVTGARGMAERIGSFIRETDWAAVWMSFKQGFIDAVNFLYGLRTKITNAIREALAGIDAADIRRVFNEVADIIRGIIPAIEESFVALWGMVKEGARVAAEFATEAWTRFSEWIASTEFRVRWEGMKEGLAQALESIKGYMADAADWIARAFDNSGKTFGNLSARISGYFRDMAVFIGDAFKSIDWGQIGGYVVDGIAAVIRQLKDFFVTAVDGGAFANVGEALGRILGSIVRAAFDFMVGAVRKLFSADTGGNIIGKIIQGALEMIGGMLVGFLDGLFGPNSVERAIINVKKFMVNMKLVFLEGMAPIIDGFWQMVTKIGNTIASGAATVADKLGLDRLAARLRAGAKAMEESGNSATFMDRAIDNAQKTIAGYDAELTRLNATTKANRSETGSMTEAARNLSTQVTKSAQPVVSITDALQNAGTAAGGSADAIKDLSNQVGVMTPNAQLVAERLRNVGDNALAAAGAIPKVGDGAKAIAEPLKKLGESLKGWNIGVNVQLPHMNEQQVKWWKQMFSIFKGMKDLNIGLVVQLPHMNEQQVNAWHSLYGALRRLKNLNFNLAIQLPPLNEAQVKLWKTMLPLFKGLPPNFNFAANIQLPHLTEQQVKLWKGFFQSFKDAQGLKIPDLNVPNPCQFGANLDRIANSLEKLVAMKGIIWT